MSIILKTSCLDDAIGLSRTDCDCYEVPVNVSESGIYIDELDGLNLKGISASAGCEEGSLWDMLKRAREQSINHFRADLLAKIAGNSGYKQARTPFTGNIAKADITANETIGNYTALKILCRPIKAGIFKVKRIGAIFAGSGTFNIDIYSNVDPTTSLHTIPVTSVNGKLNWNALNAIELPMYHPDVDYVQYYFVYQNPGFAAKNNKLRCCNFSPTYNYPNPSFARVNETRYQWYDWVNAAGITGATLASVTGSAGGSIDKAYGLVIDCELKCGVQDIICDDLDYDNSTTALAMAHALRYKAGSILIQNIISSGKLNIYTMTNLERLYQENARYKSEYAQRLDYLSQNMDVVKGGCWQCNPQMKRGSLL